MDRHSAGVAAVFTAMGIAGLALLNLLFSPGYLWFYYAAFVTVWWPLSAYFIPRRNLIGYALVGSFITIIFLAAVNLLNSPGHLWFLYAGYPFLWWPIALRLGRKTGTLSFSLVCSAITIAYYVALNVLLSPGYPWSICVVYAVLWWPLSLRFAKTKHLLRYSIAAALLTIVFFAALNLVSSPGALWAIYPVFAVLWWPLSVFCAERKSWMGFSIAGALLGSAFFAVVNAITSPGALWAVYPVFAILWWPLSMYYFNYRKKKIAQ
jgi:hypothetical protein